MRLLLLLLFLPSVQPLFGQASVDSLLQVIRERGDDPQAYRAYVNLIEVYSRTDLPRAKSLAHQGLKLVREHNMLIPTSSFYTSLVSLNQNLGAIDSANHYLQLLWQLGDNQTGVDRDKVMSNYYSAAGLFYKRQGNFREAVAHLTKAAELGEKVAPPESVAGQYLNIGNTYISAGDFGKALDFHLKALRRFEAVGNKKGQSFCLQSIAEDFIELKQFDKALDYVRKSLTMKRELNDKRGITNSLSATGRSYLGLGQYDKAFDYFSQALQMNRELQLKREEARTLVNLGMVLAEKKEPVKAMAYYSQGKQVGIEANDSSVIVSADRAMAALQEPEKKEIHNEKLLVASIEQTKAAGNRMEELSLYKTLSDLYARNGEPEKSLEYTRKYYEGKDSMLSEDVRMEANRLVALYEHEKKEAEIALLKKDQQLVQGELQREKEIRYAVIAIAALLLILAIVVINRFRALGRAKRLVEMEQMRNRIARDLHDDIGSTLSSINMLSHVLLQQTPEESANAKGLERIKSHSAGIMDNMSDIVWAINPKNDTGEKMLLKMKDFAASILEPLNIRYRFVEEGPVRQLRLDPEQRRDLYLMFKEAVNNAAKYSRCTELEILLSAEKHSLHLTVRDNGLGFYPEQVRPGNGLHNLQERSGGSMKLTTRPGSGTKVEMQVVAK